MLPQPGREGSALPHRHNLNGGVPEKEILPKELCGVEHLKLIGILVTSKVVLKAKQVLFPVRTQRRWYISSHFASQSHQGETQIAHRVPDAFRSKAPAIASRNRRGHQNTPEQGFHCPHSVGLLPSFPPLLSDQRSRAEQGIGGRGRN